MSKLRYKEGGIWKSIAPSQQEFDDNKNAVASQMADADKKTSGVVSITKWENLVLNKGLSNEDWKNAFQAAVDYLLAQTSVQKLVFPAGIYKYSVSPNWAITDVHIVNDGEVRLRYTGTENAVIIDGVARLGSNVWNMTFGRFIVEAPSTAKDGVYVKCIHHSHIDVRVRGAGTTYAGVHVLFTVANTFNIEVSSNPEGWYLDARPQIGLRISKILIGQLASYNTFINPIIEHTIQGAKIEDSLGNIFIGGTMEGSLDNGCWLTPAAGLNKFYGVDFEVNTSTDVYCEGFENEFYNVDSTKMVTFAAGAKDNTLMGGSFKSVSLNAGSVRNLVNGIKYNRDLSDGTTGTITDSGTKNRLMSNRNVKLNRVENRPAAVTSITVGASPYTYTNTTGNDERILVKGGTIIEIFLNHQGAGDVITGSQFVTLCPDDQLIVTYSAIPTMRKYTT